MSKNIVKQQFSQVNSNVSKIPYDSSEKKETITSSNKSKRPTVNESKNLYDSNDSNKNDNYNNHQSITEEKLNELINDNSSENKSMVLTNKYFIKNNIKFANFPQGFSYSPFKNNIEFPFTNFNKNNIQRCINCKGYINSFCVFDAKDKGNSWICNLCFCVNICDKSYYSMLHPLTGLRKDINERKELCNTSYEFSSNSIKENRNSFCPRYCFIFDTSHRSLLSGLFYYSITTLKHLISNNLINEFERSYISILTYDNNSISVFKFKKNSQAECMKITSLSILKDFKQNIMNELNLTTTEKELFFLPCPYKFLSVNIEDFKEEIIGCLDSLEKSIEKANLKNEIKGKNLFLHSIEFGKFLLKSKGGKIFLFNSTVIELETKIKTNKEEIIFGYHSLDYIGVLARELVAEKITLNLFISYFTYMNIVSVFPLADYTNGICFLFKNPKGNNDLDLYNDIYIKLTKELTSNTAWDCLFKIRTSNNLSITPINALFHLNNAFNLPSVKE